MQRTDPDGIVLLCDFCRRDWDGQEPMIEGHHGSILCLECLKLALAQQAVGTEKFTCTLCLRFNLPPTMPHWKNAAHREATVCQECLYQAARTFSRTEGVDWKFDPGAWPAPVKLPKPAPEKSPPTPSS